MQGRFVFLGTGGSTGVPMIGCKCEVCQSPSAYNKRMRSSGLIQFQEKRFVIDIGPDFRLQALKHHIDDLTAVFLTHAHSDHIAGIDELRAYYFLHKKKIPCFLSQQTWEEIQTRYHYMFKPLIPGKSVAAQIDFHILPNDFGFFDLLGVRFHYLTYYQTGMKVTGFRVGNFAYVSDIREFSEDVITALQGVEILVLSALRHTATPMHFSIEEAIAFSKRIFAKKTYLTHISHDLEFEKTNALLPSNVRMSYDGLDIPIEIPLLEES